MTATYEEQLVGVTERVERLIDDMSRPLPLLERVRGWHESNGGWTEATRERWLEYFKELRARLELPEASFRDEARHLLRAMDHDGIVGGRWLDDAIEIQDALWELEKLRRRGRQSRT